MQHKQASQFELVFVQVYGWPLNMSRVVGRATKPFFTRRDAIFSMIGDFVNRLKFWRYLRRGSGSSRPSVAS